MIESFQCCRYHPITLERPQDLKPIKCERLIPILHFPLEMRRNPKNQMNIILKAHYSNQNFGIYVNSEGNCWFVDRLLEM